MLYYSVVQAILHSLRVVVSDEGIVGSGPSARLRVDAQLDDAAKFVEDGRQLILGGLIGYIAQEQLVRVAVRLRVARPTIVER